jgi:hypothetical protein
MADVLMMALVVAAFVVAVLYVGLCDRLARHPEFLTRNRDDL